MIDIVFYSIDCGDGECADDEDCETCPKDCGKCPLKGWEIGLIVLFLTLLLVGIGIVIGVSTFQYCFTR